MEMSPLKSEAVMAGPVFDYAYVQKIYAGKIVPHMGALLKLF